VRLIYAFANRPSTAMCGNPAMKALPLILSAALFFQTAPAKGQCVTLGDSLTYAYEAEFGFEVWIPFVGTFGDGFNTRYATGIARLSATEILSGLHNKSAAQIDMSFAAWMTAFGLAGLPHDNDSDGDGIAAAVEFSVGLDPTRRDARKVSSAVKDYGQGPLLELAYPIRLPVSTRYSLAPAYSYDLTTPFTPFAVLPQTGPDGLARAWLPLSGDSGFLRLESTLAP